MMRGAAVVAKGGAADVRVARPSDVAMGDAALFALGTMVNGSPAMFDRRRRVLREARRMLGEGGYDAVTIRELGLRAAVSSRTIYNAFGSRESVIALAIHDYFEAFHGSMAFAAAADTFEGALERQIATTVRNVQIPNYLYAVAELYFSPRLDAGVRAVLLAIGQRSWLAWLEATRARGGIEKATAIDRLAIDLSDLQFAKVHQWGIGALAGEALLPATLHSVFTLLSGATRGETRARIRTALADMTGQTATWHARVEAAHLEIARHWPAQAGAFRP